MDTIYALSSGRPPSGVAVIRLSGGQSRFAIETICGILPAKREATLRKLRDPKTGDLIDVGLVLWFPGPESFTGEDCAEFQIHGGPAVVEKMLSCIGLMDGTRLAEPGEFTRRAFENGKHDLTEIEGLGDLVAAQTEKQRQLAVHQAGGKLRRKLEDWRRQIIEMRALIEAELDFSDEDDIPGSVSDQVWDRCKVLATDISGFLDDGNRGEIVREGFQVVLLGPPNAGKSSLLNALAKRDVAIVTEEAGTTRDVLEVYLDMGGFPVVLVDTAGLREAEGIAEQEGIRRARDRARTANLILWLSPADAPAMPPEVEGGAEIVVLRSKDDAGEFGELGVSVERADGLDMLLHRLKQSIEAVYQEPAGAIVSRHRHREHLVECVEHLGLAALESELALEIRAESLRRAGDSIGKITGSVGVEDLLDVIFSEFCVGK